MGKHVKHPCLPRQSGGEGVVGALVVEEPRLLPPGQIGHVGRTVHRHRHRGIWRGPGQHGIAIIQPFEASRPAARAFEHVGHARHRDQRGGQLVQMDFGPGGVRLHHRGIAETIDDHAGEAVGLRMDKAVERRVIEAAAQRKRAGQAFGEPVVRQLGDPGAVQHPPCNARSGVCRDKGQRFAARILQHAERAGRDRLAPPVEDEFIVINPRIAETDAARVHLWFQTKHWKVCHASL